MLMSRDEGGELRPPEWELEESSYDDAAAMLADGTITRARAIKLAGATLLGGALTVLWTDEADARRRRRKKRRRRKARVTPTPSTLPQQQQDALGNPVANEIVLSVTNPSDSKPLTISDVKLLGAEGAVVDPTVPVTIAPGATVDIPITVTYDPSSPLVDAGELRLYDGSGVPVQVTNGNTSGNVDLNFAPSV
jgi:hypothetical protein